MKTLKEWNKSIQGRRTKKVGVACDECHAEMNHVQAVCSSPCFHDPVRDVMCPECGYIGKMYYE